MKIYFKNRFSLYLLIFGSYFIFNTCTEETQSDQIITKNNPSVISNDLIIGSKNQSDEYQLGLPMAVRTDEDGNIYIADKASLTIKIFDSNGRYKKSIGGRGRGPGEFQEFSVNLMGITPDEHFIFLDRGKLQFTILSKNGEFIKSYPYNFIDQVYPSSISYVNDQIVGLYVDTVNDPNEDKISEFERPLFHIYSTDFQERRGSFLLYDKLDHDNLFVFSNLIYQPGSFAISKSPDKQRLVYSPGIYDGKLYEFVYTNETGWRFEKVLEGFKSKIGSYETYFHESDYERNTKLGIPGLRKIYYGTNSPHIGRVISMDAGIYYLNNKELVHFYIIWPKDDNIKSDSKNSLDLYFQIFDSNGDLKKTSYVTSIERSKIPKIPLVNWKDSENNFYLINLPESDIPTVQRFSIEI